MGSRNLRRRVGIGRVAVIRNVTDWPSASASGKSIDNRRCPLRARCCVQLTVLLSVDGGSETTRTDATFQFDGIRQRAEYSEPRLAVQVMSEETCQFSPSTLNRETELQSVWTFGTEAETRRLEFFRCRWKLRVSAVFERERESAEICRIPCSENDSK